MLNFIFIIIFVALFICSRQKRLDKMRQESQTYLLIKWTVIALDLLVLNVLLSVLYMLSPSFIPRSAYENYQIVYFVLNVVYAFCVSKKGPILYMRKIRPEEIVGRVFSLILWFAPLSFLAMHYMSPYVFPWKFALCFYSCLFVCVTFSRLCSRAFIKWHRRRGRNTRDVLFVGSYSNMIDLYNEMMGDPTTGYRVLGYFDDEIRTDFEIPIPYLGTIDKIPEYMEKSKFHPMGRVYCCLPSARADEIKSIIDYCENHLIRFYSVPNVRNYLRRPMRMEMIGDVPVLYIRDEPMREPLNRFQKRLFDIVFSSLFLCLFFPLIYLIVGIITKITSPGPVFFKQKRNGLNGEEFDCYKFRSMKVNTQCDTLQATEHDPRKTKFGNFLRKSSIDELPQFINVLKGDMSIVGPRPHMLKHTEEYSELINKYMVRHFIKPGITGWAQVNGCRGETKELAQMEARIKKDIWYVENWSFWLDIRIIYLTIRNALRGDANAY